MMVPPFWLDPELMPRAPFSDRELWWLERLADAMLIAGGLLWMVLTVSILSNFGYSR